MEGLLGGNGSICGWLGVTHCRMCLKSILIRMIQTGTAKGELYVCAAAFPILSFSGSQFSLQQWRKSKLRIVLTSFLETDACQHVLVCLNN